MALFQPISRFSLFDGRKYELAGRRTGWRRHHYRGKLLFWLHHLTQTSLSMSLLFFFSSFLFSKAVEGDQSVPHHGKLDEWLAAPSPWTINQSRRRENGRIRLNRHEVFVLRSIPPVPGWCCLFADLYATPQV